MGGCGVTWRSLSATGFRGEQASLALIEAYAATFTKSQHGEMVLADLAAVSGFFGVLIGDDSRAPRPDDLMFQEGMRALYGRIHQHLSLPDERLRELHEAVRRESAAQGA